MAFDIMTPKQRRFVDEYLVDLCAKAAAIRAGYSSRTAESIGLQLLRKTQVKAAVEARIAARAQRTEVKQDDVLRELARIAFADPRKVMAWGPGGVKLRESTALTDDEAALVAEVGETTSKDGGSLKLKTNDKLKALELLGRHLGMFKNGDDGARSGEGLVVQLVMPSSVER